MIFKKKRKKRIKTLVFIVFCRAFFHSLTHNSSTCSLRGVAHLEGWHKRPKSAIVWGTLPKFGTPWKTKQFSTRWHLRTFAIPHISSTPQHWCTLAQLQKLWLHLWLNRQLVLAKLSCTWPLIKPNNWCCELHLGKTFGYAFGLIEQLVIGATPWL